MLLIAVPLFCRGFGKQGFQCQGKLLVLFSVYVVVCSGAESEQTSIVWDHIMTFSVMWLFVGEKSGSKKRPLLCMAVTRGHSFINIDSGCQTVDECIIICQISLNQ